MYLLFNLSFFNLRSTHSHRTTEHDLRVRRRVGSSVRMEDYGKMIADDDEVDVLENRDIDEMAAHRMDKMGAVGRHKISRTISKQDDLVRVRRLVIVKTDIPYKCYNIGSIL